MANTFDYTENPEEGDEVTLADGSIQVYDGEKWIDKEYDTLFLKIFQSPTDNLTKVSTFAGGVGVVYEVRKTSDNSLATIYSDKDGSTSIPQNGTANVSNGDAECVFYIADGDYTVTINAVSAIFNVGTGKCTVSEISSGLYARGSILSVTDRSGAVFEVVSGGAPNGFDIIDAGGGNTATLISKQPTIQMFGGVDDWDGVSGTNNADLIDYLVSNRPITIRMPKTLTGVYLYDGVTTSPESDFFGVNVVSDEGVTIYSTGTGNSPLWRKGVTHNREFKSKVGGANYNLYSSPEQYKKPSEQWSKLTHGDGNIDELQPVDFSSSDVRCYELSAWPAGTLNVITPTSATSADLDLGAIPSSSFKMAGIPVAAGDMVQAHIAAPAVRACVFVETDAGYVIVQQAPTDGSYEVQKFENNINTSFSVVDKLFNQEEYRFTKSSLGIVIYNSNEFGLLVNNILVKRISTTGGIQIAGWGAGFDTANLVINRPSAFYRKKSVGIKQLRIVGVGDSTSADTLPPSQFQYMKQYLAGSCGAQVFELRNLAVGGQTSTEQRAALLGEDISGMDYCLIQVGINDVQTGAPPLNFLSNVEDMLDYCESNNVVPIVGLPTSWYSQSSAQAFGQDGQATNSGAGASIYRNVLMHGLANRGGVLMNSSVLEDTGAVLAEWLSVEGADPRVQDNIHPTALNQMCMGMSYAKAIIGHTANFKPIQQGVHMPSYWFNSGIGATTTPTMHVSDNTVTCNWFLSKNSVSIADGDIIATTPDRFKPRKTFFCQTVNTKFDSELLADTNQVGQLRFGDDGTVRGYNLDDTTCQFISINCSWTIK